MSVDSTKKKKKPRFFFLFFVYVVCGVRLTDQKKQINLGTGSIDKSTSHLFSYSKIWGCSAFLLIVAEIKVRTFLIFNYDMAQL